MMNLSVSPFAAALRLFPRLAAAAAALSLAGCSSGFYTRETLQLGGPQLQDYSIRYESLEGCLLRQQVPMQYRVDRREYRLMLRMVPSYENSPPAVEVRLQGASTLTARFPGVEHPPEGYATPEETRYVLESTALPPQTLTIEVYSEQRKLGVERLSFERHSCRAFGFG
jgi:hypothetical protein